MKYLFMVTLFLGYIIQLFSQERTVGLLSYDESQTYEGYNLLYPHGQSKTYLINNCGEIVHEWEEIEDHVPGNSAYLLENGTLIRCYRYFNATNDTIWAGGGGQFVQALDWEGNLLWTFEQNDTLKRIHHDIEVMPNGNVLMISWEKKTKEESIQAGRDPENINLGKLWPDYVLEYDPNIDSVVWEWHSWDHLIQDFNPDVDNFGDVVANPGKIDINYENNLGNADWHHMNSIDYHPGLDQIMLSVPHFDEIWIIDHSTTTEEAKSTTGGNSGKGGEILFRWGNPKAHRSGDDEDQKLFFQHDAQWIQDFISSDDPLYDKVLIFNNRFAEDHSVISMIQPEYEADGYNYILEDQKYLPVDYEKLIFHPDTTTLWSTGLSSVQYLPNGNYLIIAGRFGYAFELNSDNEVVWEYKMPFSGGQPVPQGTELDINANLTFRFKRYPTEFPAFIDKDLSPKGLIQIEENDDLCARIVKTEDRIINFDLIRVNNPVTDQLILNYSGKATETIRIFNLGAQMIFSDKINPGENRIDVSNLIPGAYFIQVGNSRKKLLKVNG